MKFMALDRAADYQMLLALLVIEHEGSSLQSHC